jgi:hypothetical protein
LLFDTNTVNLVAGGSSAIKLELSNGKISINNTNSNLDTQINADDGEVILHADAGTNRVGINTITPNNSLEVVGGANITGSSSVSGSLLITGSSTLAVRVTGSTALTGSLLHSGSTALTGSLLQSGSIALTGSLLQKGDTQISGSGTISGSLLITGSTALALRITGSTALTGSLLNSGSTVTTGSVEISGSLGVGTAASGVIGAILAANDVVAFASSDERLKENITLIENPLDKIIKISGYEYDWVPMEGVHVHSGHDIGVIAQEVEKVFPEIVADRDNGYKAVKYEKLVSVLIEGIKELKQEVDLLKKKING